ncbi:hypothetical protein VPNG_07526 [Cytospora leucostoma]|uniref:ABM domain-containing protein n=1 Tax=Cytospora leucostoma TaxID=1230097 RepID=A0A423WSB3_9PEZI|nr:hypothetical protein VPNG_07526 [Cytospora leucostoma]
MPVTELATLPLAPGVSLADEGFRAKLLRSKIVMENALGIHGRRFAYYQSTEDYDLLYLLGDWQSTGEHWEEFIPSPANQELLELLKHDLDLPGIEMYHVDIPAAEVPTYADTISIGWSQVRQDDQAGFEKKFSRYKEWAKDHFRQGRVPAGGWRIETAEGQQGFEQFVLIGGWEGVDAYLGFAKTESTEGCYHAQEFIESFDVKHGIRIGL